MRHLPFILLLMAIIFGACQKNDFTDHCIITPQGDTIFLNDSTPPPHALTFKEIKKKGEDAKVAVRNIRRDGNEAFKKLKELMQEKDGSKHAMFSRTFIEEMIEEIKRGK